MYEFNSYAPLIYVVVTFSIIAIGVWIYNKYESKKATKYYEKIIEEEKKKPTKNLDI